MITFVFSPNSAIISNKAVYTCVKQDYSAPEN